MSGARSAMNGRPRPRDIVWDVLRIAARYLLAGALFHSGMRMVLGLAGTDVGPVEWVTPLGEFSGAEFAGVWLGISPVFQALGGLTEMAAGALLLRRRTTTLGAIVAVGCLANSVMLRLYFPPSPWMAEAGLLVVATLLVCLDWRVLTNLLLLERPTVPLAMDGAWETPRTRNAGLILRATALGFVGYVSGVEMIRLKYDAAVQSELAGVYAVASFSPSDAALEHQWRMAAIDRYGERLTVRTMDGAGRTFRLEPVSTSSATSGHRAHVAAIAMPPYRVMLIAPNGSGSLLDYSRPSPDRLVISGEVDGVGINADLRLIEPESLPFVNGKLSFAEPR